MSAILLLVSLHAASGQACGPDTETFPIGSISVGYCAGVSSLECGDVFGEGEFVNWDGEETVRHHTWRVPHGHGGGLQLKIDLDLTGVGETTGYVYTSDGETNRFRFEFSRLPFSTTVTTTNVVTATGDPDGFYFVVHSDYHVRVTASGDTIVRTFPIYDWSVECPVGTLYECGNGICESGELGEGCGTCPSDCGECTCGDGCCQTDEDAASCPDDCTAPGAACEELTGPSGGADTCTDTTPENCVCQGCVDDGVCSSDDDCTCADCADEIFCGNVYCFTDGICDAFSEGCDCPECASAAPLCLL